MTNTLDILHEARAVIASELKDFYGHIVYKKTQVAQPESWGYHLTGLDFGFEKRKPVLQIRMQIKEAYDEKRKIHYARLIPTSRRDATLLMAQYLKEAKERGEYQEIEIQGRHPQLTMRTDKQFRLPTHGFGIYTTFEDPTKVAETLNSIDTILDDYLDCPRVVDPEVMKLLEKIGESEFYNP